MKYILLMLFGALVLEIAQSNLAIENFFSFGELNGDTNFPPIDDDCQLVNFTQGYTYKFCGVSYNGIYICTNGVASFSQAASQSHPPCDGTGPPRISTFWADADIELCTVNDTCSIGYRISKNSADITKATEYIRKAFPSLYVKVRWVFVATWYNVPFYGATSDCGGIDLRNTYQMILCSDGAHHSFVILYYHEIEWTSGSGAGDCQGQNGNAPEITVNCGNGIARSPPESCVANTTSTFFESFANGSNIDITTSGIYVLRTDQGPEIPESSAGTSGSESYYS